MKYHEPAEAEEFEFCRSRIDLNDTAKVVQEYDDHGNHRLSFGEHHSEWVHYRAISQLRVPKIGQYMGTSPYWGESMPRVFQFIVSMTESMR
jgi:hypothetical protein